MALAIRVDWEGRAVHADRARIEVGSDGQLGEDIRRLCSPAQPAANGEVRYRVLKKVTFGGHTGECVIDVNEGRLASVTILFEMIRFFDKSITESKIVRSIAKSAGLTVVSEHPAVAQLEPCAWGVAEFRYDPRQGDLSFEVQFRND